MARRLNSLGILLEDQIAELKQQSRTSFIWTWLLAIVGIAFCVVLFFYCIKHDLEKALSFGPSLVSASAALPFRNRMTLRRQLTLMAGLKQCHDDDTLSEEERDHVEELAKEALKSGLRG